MWGSKDNAGANAMLLLQVIVGGLLLGAIYALFSSGLTLIWGMMNFINFAHGEFVMLGMYVALLVVTWLDRADRSLLETHPRNDPALPLTGVFATRSPHRPNPLGLHRVTVREIAGLRLRIGPIEAIDGTPVVDLKAVLGGGDDER